MARSACGYTLVLALMASGCQPRSPAPTATVPDTMTYTDSRFEFSVRVPPGWQAEPTDEFALLVSPAGDPSGAARGSEVSLSIDVPRLPPHLPGMIRLSLVQNGFINDVEKRFDELAVLEDRAADVHDAESRMLLLSWLDDGRQFKQRAVLMIHAGRVYILRATAPVESFGTVDEALEGMLNSLEWTG